MGLTLKEIKNIQMKFDKCHKANIAFFEKIQSKEDIPKLEHLVVCMLGELGEFSNIVKKIHRGDLNFFEQKNNLEEELTDVFVYLIKICNQMNIDLEKTYLKKMKKNKKKFVRFEVK